MTSLKHVYCQQMIQKFQTSRKKAILFTAASWYAAYPCYV